jgi:hypothetical protein
MTIEGSRSAWLAGLLGLDGSSGRYRYSSEEEGGVCGWFPATLSRGACCADRVGIGTCFVELQDWVMRRLQIIGQGAHLHAVAG